MTSYARYHRPAAVHVGKTDRESVCGLLMKQVITDPKNFGAVTCKTCLKLLAKQRQ